MDMDAIAPRSRRALLTAAAGAAGALAAQAALPLTAAAVSTNLLTEVNNPTTATTSVTQSSASVAFKATTATAGAAGLVGSTGDETLIATNTSFTGVYGWSPTGGLTDTGTGVWGDSADIGVLGTGAIGVQGEGAIGVHGLSISAAGPGVLAQGVNANSPALEVVGKVKFSRSGRKAMKRGKASIVISLAGVTTGSKVFAVLATTETGRWVRAVVPAADKFTVYLNTTLSSGATVAWFVLD